MTTFLYSSTNLYEKQYPFVSCINYYSCRKNNNTVVNFNTKSNTILSRKDKSDNILIQKIIKFNTAFKEAVIQFCIKINTPFRGSSYESCLQFWS